MPRKRSPREPTTEFHMRTRNRSIKTTPEPSNSSLEDSSLSELGTPPDTPPSILSSATRKRKRSSSSSGDPETPSESTQPRRRNTAVVAVPDPIKSRKRRRRPPVSGLSDTSSTSKTDRSSPATQSSITPPDSAKSSRRNSAATRSDSADALPETEVQAQIQAASTVRESSTALRRSARHIKPSILQGPLAVDAPPNEPSSSTAEAPSENARKRKPSGAASDASETVPKRRRTLRTAKQATTQKSSNCWDKEKEIWPEFDRNNVIYYANDGTTQYHPAEGDETPESRSPKKPTRGGARTGRGGGHSNGGGRKGKPKGRGGRGGSPDPPERRQPLSQEEKAMISILKARQQELKRFFSVVGAQQFDILEQLANRDLNRMAKKSNAHKKVPEYAMIVEELEAAKQDAEDLVRKRYDIQLEAEMRRLEAEKEVIEQQWKNRRAAARKEHLAAAEGDIILFERAYRAAHDDTHTESGSDMMEYFPHYHELPEPDTQPRGYTSSRIKDEKPFKRQLGESYDEQARQQVLNEDVIGPLLKQIEQRNKEWRAEQLSHKSRSIDALTEEAAKELAKIGGYLVPRPMDMAEANSFALSALADVSEWVAQQYPQKQYIYVPLAKGEAFPVQGLDFSPLPGQAPPPPRPQQAYQQVIRTNSRPRGRRLKYPPLTYEQAVSATTSSPGLPPLQPQHHTQPQGVHFPPPTTTAPLAGPLVFEAPRIISSGPGQPIAPAPPKAAPAAGRPSVDIFRHNTRYPPPPPPPSHTSHARQNSLTIASSPPQQSQPQYQPQPQPQQYIFQTPQQPFQHQAAPPPTQTQQYGPPASTAPVAVITASGPSSSPAGLNATSPSGPIAGQQTKMPMTFVNQTIESRTAAAAGQASTGPGNGNGHGNGANAAGNDKGSGRRVLLPKF
ncbi:hypothetical protein A1O7_07439 [Cladophialophora yegresii CBS 114405]|uniref:Uncharacterized protein n=1 Tax=Cladophialophora yegresii CBS 114405 TaxID=1182544 RepID=W9VWL7_9EURO|nr:uncharacterized protein A1O7_07439 [Cladophialophora yegresii CBS 114405]EXJ57095.1 hypothetical protein A1O7_07439 [Cladophialophora yegresii CBS 114405]